MTDDRLIKEYVSQVLAERGATAKKTSHSADDVSKGPASSVRKRRVTMPPSGLWVKWNPRNPFPYKSNNRDMGPGEERLAWELGGATQGHSVSYDVIDQDGKKWEIKEPNDSNMIRPGVEGRRALTPIRQQLEEVCRQLVEGFDLIDFEALETLTEDAPLDPSEVAHFIAHDVPMITSGEISVGRIMGGTRVNPIGLLQVLEFVRFMIGDAVKAPPREVKWGELTKIVDVGSYVHASRALGLSDAEIGATVDELFAGTFRHIAFRKPKTFIREVWHNSVRASMVFPDVSGVIIVSSEGFLIVPRDELDVYFKFMYISKGEPRFFVQD